MNRYGVLVDLARVFDVDGDGVDDRWERLSGLDPTSGTGADGAAGDPDGDGMSNAVEFAASSEFSGPGPGFPHPNVHVRRYFAEGASNGFFTTQLALVNPDPSHPAAVYVRYAPPGNDATVSQPILVPPLGRRTALPNALSGVYNASFAIEIESDRPVVVDRRMTWDATGYGASLEWATSCPPPRHNFTSIPRIRSERPAFDLNHPEAGIPVGVGPAKDAPEAPVVDAADGEVK